MIPNSTNMKKENFNDLELLPEDAVIAAPNSHEVLFEDEHTRVLKIQIQPGLKEPFHTHQWPSEMMIIIAANIIYYDYYDENNKSRKIERPARQKRNLVVESLAPEPLHAVENIDIIPYLGIRVEYKQ